MSNRTTFLVAQITPNNNQSTSAVRFFFAGQQRIFLALLRICTLWGDFHASAVLCFVQFFLCSFPPPLVLWRFHILSGVPNRVQT